jgi:hypothetical protein
MSAPSALGATCTGGSQLAEAPGRSAACTVALAKPSVQTATAFPERSLASDAAVEKTPEGESCSSGSHLPVAARRESAVTTAWRPWVTSLQSARAFPAASTVRLRSSIVSLFGGDRLIALVQEPPNGR